MNSIRNKFKDLAILYAMAAALDMPAMEVGEVRERIRFEAPKIPLTKKQLKARAKNKQQRLSRKINRQKRA